MSWRAAWWCVLALTSACAGPSYDAGRAHTIAVGQPQERVRNVMGRPDHMEKTLEHPKSCTERWTYGEPSRGAFLVDFDNQGSVCDVAFTP
jgi:hypothetical protein